MKGLFSLAQGNALGKII